MKWFKHDTDASIDAKLQELLLDYGASGYGLYWYCVELIAQNVNDSNITFELEHDARIIARNLNLTVQETKDMMQKMINLELFSISKNNKLACYALAKRLDQSMTSSPKFRNLISQIKENNHDKVMTKSKVNHDKVMQEEKRREKKRKEEIRIEDKKETLLLEFLKDNSSMRKYDDVIEDFISYRKQIKKPLKTIAPIKLYINSLLELENLGYGFDFCIEQMKSNEWQTIKVDYIHKKKSQQFTQKSRAESNADFIRQHYGMNEDNIIDTEIM